jgi:tRNA-specific 2-thiouridylase
MRILVALSGGADSSVTACLLAEQGHDVIGLQMDLWFDPAAPAIATILPSKCCNAQTRYRAEAVSRNLSIPFHRVSVEREFKEQVVDAFLEAHRKGETPSPCILCNRNFKFRVLLEKADELGCDMVATGHYARIAQERLSDGSTRMVLLEACDKSKDQSYFLYALPQETLHRTLFPLGTLTKERVFALAREYEVPLPACYQESQDLCFFPEKTPRAFLNRHLKESMDEGPIIDKEGKRLGTHRGLPHYTIGQRRRLGIGGLKAPLQVVEKDIESNTLIVGPPEENETREIHAHDVHWITQPLHATFSCEVRTCHQGARKPAQVNSNGETMIVKFDSPQRRASPGQHIVCYLGEEILGGGVM